MATINFEVKSNSENATIYVRVSLDRKRVYRRKSGYSINSKDWSKATKSPKNNDVDLKNQKAKLDKFKLKLTQLVNLAIEDNVNIDGTWLQDQIDVLHGRRKLVSLDILVNYFDHYINNLPTKIRPNGTQGTKKTTITKYKTLKGKIVAFEKFRNKRILVKDVNLEFRTEFITYLRDIENLGLNTIGRYIPFVKSVCRDAKVNGIETHHQLDAVKGYTVKAEKLILVIDELELMLNKDFQREALENARDWLVLGCYVGQRVSDLLFLTKDNLIFRNGLDFIELTQQKTDKAVVIPVHPIVKQILERRGGGFPRKISASKFNLHIKEVARLSGLTEIIYGGKIDPETNRKAYGYYPKYELVTSHICRRSFASNFYGDIPTALLIKITAHSSEKQFLEYIGKSEIDHAQQLAEYWMVKSKKN